MHFLTEEELPAVKKKSTIILISIQYLSLNKDNS